MAPRSTLTEGLNRCYTKTILMRHVHY